jgi:hypothetical protein
VVLIVRCRDDAGRTYATCGQTFPAWLLRFIEAGPDANSGCVQVKRMHTKSVRDRLEVWCRVA